MITSLISFMKRIWKGSVTIKPSKNRFLLIALRVNMICFLNRTFSLVENFAFPGLLEQDMRESDAFRERPKIA
jgi:hypothetical protein